MSPLKKKEKGDCMKTYIKFYRWLGPILGVCLTGGLIWWMTQTQQTFTPTLSYQVQLADELYYSDEAIQAWVDQVREKKGIYTQTIDKFVYLAICAGTQPDNQLALALVDTIQSNKKIEVIYSIVKQESEMVKPIPTQPFMLVRVPKSWNVKLVGKEIAESEIPAYLEKSHQESK